jgi:MFS family permease
MEQQSGKYKWELVFLLWFALFFNQADRQVFNVVLPLIRSDLGLSDPQLGLVGSILVWTLAAMVPIAGYAGDVFSRKWIIVCSLLFWSAATLSTGLSTCLLHLVLLRSVATGFGESFYVSAANALISSHHDKTRALAMSVHQTGVYAGIILSGLVGGWIGDHYGWRHSFYAFGIAGVVTAIVLALRLRPDAPAGAGSSGAPAKASFAEAFRAFAGKRTALLLSLAFAMMAFANIGYLGWMPTYLFERFGVSLTEGGFSSMFYHHSVAFVGVLAGARLADRLAARRPVFRVYIQAAGLLLGAPFICATGLGGSFAVVMVGLAGFGFFRGVYDSNLFASLYEVIPAAYRSTATGLMTMFAFLVGACASYVLGAMKPHFGLANGFLILGGCYVVGGLALLAASLTLPRERVT